MARLDPLIKVRKHVVDEKQRVLAQLYAEQEKIRALKARLLAEFAREQELAQQNPSLDVTKWMAAYATGVQGKLNAIDAAINRLETRIMVATDDVRAAFAELKKIEITDRERKKRERKDRDDKESRTMDDIGIEGHRRKADD